MATSYWDYKVPLSLFQRTRNYLSYHLSLRKIMREIFTWMNVPFYDCACPEAETPGNPVRVVVGEGNTIQYFDGEDWVDSGITTYTAPTGYTGTINGTDGDWEFDNGVLVDFTPAP